MHKRIFLKVIRRRTNVTSYQTETLKIAKLQLPENLTQSPQSGEQPQSFEFAKTGARLGSK